MRQRGRVTSSVPCQYLAILVWAGPMRNRATRRPHSREFNRRFHLLACPSPHEGLSEATWCLLPDVVVQER